MQGRNVSYSKTEHVHLVQPADLNGGGRLFGGIMMKMIDEVAAIVAMRHTGLKTVTTAAVDSLVFKSAAYVNDLVVFIGYITYTGRTSMEVRIDAYVERSDGLRYPINRAHLVLVALDENNKPTAVPPLITENDIQKEEFALAKKRIELHKKESRAVFRPV